VSAVHPTWVTCYVGVLFKKRQQGDKNFQKGKFFWLVKNAKRKMQKDERKRRNGHKKFTALI
jgi:hypothetical protein